MAGAEKRAAARTQPHTAAAMPAGEEVTLLAMRGAAAPMTTAAVHDAPGRRTTGGRAFVAALPGPFGRLPPAAFFAGAGMLATLGLFCAAVAFRSDASIAALERQAGTTTPAGAPRENDPTAAASAATAPAATAEEPPSPTARAPAAELDRAREAGKDALTQLAERYPGDPVTLKALMMAQTRGKDGYMPAVHTAKRLLALAPDEARDDDLRQVILRAANAPPDVASVAFDLMANHMGGRGADLLYELVIASSFGKLPRDRASKLLLEPEVRKTASLALLIADDLRRLSECPTKPLLERARDQGDGRALHYLKPLLVPYKCGPLNMRSCTRCVGVHAQARAAISAIEKRRAP